MIHVYTFLTEKDEDDHRQVLVKKIQAVIRSFDETDIEEIFNIRDVSATKRMYSVSFRLSKDVALDQPIKQLKLV